MLNHPNLSQKYANTKQMQIKMGEDKSRNNAMKEFKTGSNGTQGEDLLDKGDLSHSSREILSIAKVESETDLYEIDPYKESQKHRRNVV